LVRVRVLILILILLLFHLLLFARLIDDSIKKGGETGGYILRLSLRLQ
jgi:hypothetical protein